MPLRNWNEVPYLPLLALSPAEMDALSQMPNKNKDVLLPLIHLRPWLAAHHLDHAIGRIEGAYGERPYVLALGPALAGDAGKDRPVFDELRSLRDPRDGYAAWCDFIDHHPNIIPTLQLAQPAELAAQSRRLHGLGRGLAVHLEPDMLGAAEPIVRAIAAGCDGGDQVCIVVDFGRQGPALLLNQIRTAALVELIRREAPNACVAISASSFPSSFTNISEQDIFERQHFNGVAAQVTLHLDPDELLPKDCEIHANRCGAKAKLTSDNCAVVHNAVIAKFIEDDRLEVVLAQGLTDVHKSERHGSVSRQRRRPIVSVQRGDFAGRLWQLVLSAPHPPDATPP